MWISMTNSKGQGVKFARVWKQMSGTFTQPKLILALAGFLWARSSLFGSFHPFALAAVSAIALVYPRGLLLALPGIGLGLFSSLGSRGILPYLLLCSLVLLGSFLAKRQGGTISYQLIFGSFYTGAAVLIGRVVLATVAGEEPAFLYFAILEAVLSGLLVAIMSYFGTKVKDLNSLAKTVGHEELAFAFLLGGIAIAGLDGMYLGPLPLQDLALRIAVILSAWIGGPGAGAITGVAGGIIVALLSNFSPYHLAALAMAGICAGLFRPLGKLGLIFGSAAGAALLSYQLLTPVEILEAASSVLGASLFILIVPVDLIEKYRVILPIKTEVDSRIVGEDQRIRAWVSERLVTFGEVLGELAHSFAQLPKDKVSSDPRDISKMINAVSERVCSGCERYQTCWEDQFYGTFKNFETALVEAENSGSLQMKQLPAGIRGHCHQMHKLVQAVNYLLELHRVETSWEQKLLSSREIVSNQLRGVADVMVSLAEEMQERRSLQEDPSKTLCSLFLRKGLPVKDVRAVLRGDNQFEVRVTCAKCEGRESCRELIPLAANFLETQFSLAKPSCGYYTGDPLCEINLVPKKVYRLEYKVVEATKKGSRINGDNHSLIALPGGKIGVALSDGMGSGSRAALESSTTLSLLEQLLRAGLDRRFAIRAINSLLLFRSPEESFATLDLLLFDEYTGEAEFVKIGCQPTYILRGSEVLKIEGQSLPIGIISQVDASIVTDSLYTNDYLVMFTDGAKDCCLDLPGDWFEKVLAQAPRQDAPELADYLLKQVLAVSNGAPGDDLTIAVARVRNLDTTDGISVYSRRKTVQM